MTGRRVRHSAAVAVAAVFAACAPLRLHPSPHAPEDAAVYRAVLQANPAKLVQRTTQPPVDLLGNLAEVVRGLPAALPGMHESAVRSLFSRNADSLALPELRDSTLVLIGAAEWRSLAQTPGGWDELGRRAPHPVVLTLSRPGYSRDGLQALIYVITACPGLCSEARFLLLTRADDGWVIQGSARHWIS